MRPADGDGLPSRDGLPERRPLTDACLDELDQRLGPDRLDLDDGARRTASRDHAWLSPVLTEDLDGIAPADVVITPRDETELATVLGVAHDHGVALTTRGKGTGNYGQAVPLAGGILLDTTAIDGVVDVTDGWITARCGTSFTRLETAARASGQELAMFPSTVSSTLAGFLAGGAGGTGSLENGFVWDGFVDELTVLPCHDAPEPVTLDAAAALPHLHAYGTTGAITSARVALRPARERTALFASFPTFEAAAAAGRELWTLDPPLRNLSVDDPDLSTVLAGAHPAIRPQRANLRATLTLDHLSAVRGAVDEHGGTVEAVDPGLASLCVSLSYNHVTLRAKRLDEHICHVQAGGEALVGRRADISEILDGALVHLDAHAPGGHPGWGGLVLAPYPGRERLRSAMDELAELGAFVVDPHTWRLGGHGDLTPTREAAARFDPSGLLNPGKLPPGP